MVYLLWDLSIKVEVSIAEIVENVVCVSDMTWPPAGDECVLVEEEFAGYEGVCWPCKVRIGRAAQGGHELRPDVVEETPSEYVVETRTGEGNSTNAA